MAYSFSWFHSRLLSLYKGVVPIVFAFIRRPSRLISLSACLSLHGCVSYQLMAESILNTVHARNDIDIKTLISIANDTIENGTEFWKSKCVWCQLFAVSFALFQINYGIETIVFLFKSYYFIFFFVSFCLYFGRLKCC